MDRPNKKVSDSKTESYHLLKYEDINGAGRLFGGRLLSWIDSVGAMTTRRHAGTNCTTASVDNLVFTQPAKLGEIVVLCGQVTYVGNTSLEVRVDSYVDKLDGERKLINTAYLIYVCLDKDDKPIPVPYGLEVQSAEEQEEMDAAIKRRVNRAYRKQQNF